MLVIYRITRILYVPLALANKPFAFKKKYLATAMRTFKNKGKKKDEVEAATAKLKAEKTAVVAKKAQTDMKIK
ncbi:hypothetical protein Tco_0703583, partial [Tanacetum coccineum]